MQTIQNITNYHIDLPQQIILAQEDRSLDRIMERQAENRQQFFQNLELDQHSGPSQAAPTSPKNTNVIKSKITLRNVNRNPGQVQTDTGEVLAKNMKAQDSKAQTNSIGKNFTIQNPYGQRVPQHQIRRNFDQVHNTSFFSANPKNSQPTSKEVSLNQLTANRGQSTQKMQQQ